MDQNVYPNGRLNNDDEGALTLAISEEQRNVRIDFGKPVAWLALPPEQALQFASLIAIKARAIMSRN